MRYCYSTTINVSTYSTFMSQVYTQIRFGSKVNNGKTHLIIHNPDGPKLDYRFFPITNNLDYRLCPITNNLQRQGKEAAQISANYFYIQKTLLSRISLFSHDSPLPFDLFDMKFFVLQKYFLFLPFPMMVLFRHKLSSIQGLRGEEKTYFSSPPPGILLRNGSQVEERISMVQQYAIPGS